MPSDPTTTALRAALLRLLEDWEAGRDTVQPEWPRDIEYELLHDGLIVGEYASPGLKWTLTPAGLAAARAEKERKT